MFKNKVQERKKIFQLIFAETIASEVSNESLELMMRLPKP